MEKKHSSVSRRDLLRIAMLGAGTAAAGPLLAACGGGGTGGGNRAISYLSQAVDPAEIAWFDRIDEAFGSANPGVDVRGENLDGTSALNEKLQTLLVAGSPPDFIPQSGSSDIYQLWAQGLLRPVNDIMEAIGLDRFDEAALQLFEIDGDFMAVPFVGVAELLWYRKDLADEAGVEPPTNWSEWLAFARALHNDGMYGTTVPFGRNAACNRWFLRCILQNGGNIVDEDLNVVFDSPENEEALEFMLELSQYSPPGSSNYAFAEQLGTFVSGAAASSVYYGRAITAVEEQNAPLGEHIAAVQVPFAREPFNYVEISGAYVFRDGPGDASLVRDYIANYMFDPEYYADWVLSVPGAGLTTIPSVAELDSYRSNPLVTKYSSIMQLLTEQLSKGGNWAKESPRHPVNTQGGAVGTGTVLADVVQRVLINDEPIKASLARGAQELEEIMKDARPL
jgi:multiple sugar transport system substrate-binding protein